MPRAQPAPAALFIRNRQRLRDLLPPKALAILHSNDLMPTNADGVMGFRQNNDLFYLSGIDQEDTILVLFPDAVREEQREMLFIRETNEHVRLWEGPKLEREAATELSGIKTIRWSHEFSGILRSLVMQADSIHLATNEHPRLDSEIVTRSERFAASLRERFPLHCLRRLAPLITALRMVKQPEEIEMTREACRITTAGYHRVLRTIRPGIGEWEIEAELAHTFIRNKSRGFAYPPIIGSGGNACALHYVDNNAICRDGDLVLLDVAAEYGNWNADLTRTIPVNGRYSPRQREVYEAVLRLLRFAESILRPGIGLLSYQKQIIDRTEEEVVRLGLVSAEDARQQGPDKPLVKKFLPHGCSHHLGLDVHDVARDGAIVEAGHLFTIEPGIYIPEENLGIRLENDYLIGADGNINLFPDAPIEPDEVEAAMADR